MTPPTAGPPAGGTVVWVSRRTADVLGPDGAVETVAVRGRLRPVVGDRVEIARRRATVYIHRIERRGAVLQKRARQRTYGHVLAANVDTLGIVTAVGEQFRAGLVDRLLVTAAVAGIEPLLIVNKTDRQAALDETRATMTLYETLGVPTVATSALTGDGLDALAGRLRGRVTALAGHSGVGKSSLLNALVPEAEREVGELSEHSGTGRHITTSARGFAFEGGLIIDLPGVRLFGLTALEPVELLAGFRELAPYAAGCRFPNCSHSHEPDCAVRDAAERGAVTHGRYASYLRLLEEVEAVADGRPPS